MNTKSVAWVTVVRSAASAATVSRSAASLSASSWEVASSSRSSRGRRSSARAMATRWRSSPDSLMPRLPRQAAPGAGYAETAGRPADARREHTGGVDRERAEAHLRLLAEAELRGAVLRSGNSTQMARVARVLTAVGALDDRVAVQIVDDFELAAGARQAGAPGWRGPAAGQVPPPPGPGRVPVTPGRVVPVGQLIPVRAATVSGEIHLLSYARPASRGLLTMIARPRGQAGPADPFYFHHFTFHHFTATDDRGTRYGIGLHGSGPGGPPQAPRWEPGALAG
jgi:hypothetical protein